MTTTSLANNASEAVRASSPDASVASLQSITGRMRRYNRWLTTRHPYNDVIKALGKARSVDEQRLGEYIACSAPLHLADGWNYLSRAFDATSRGDRYTACHLAYYAELRAAMSLLATEGMGVFLNWHIALDSSLQATRFHGRNTHVAAWELLSAWSQEGRAEKLLRTISLESKSLADWLAEVGVGAQERQLLAGDWLRSWSLDLKIISGDRARRNEVSYRPGHIRIPAPPAVDPHMELIEPLFNSWMALEPLTDKGSVALDAALLSKALRLVTKKSRCNYSSYEKAVGSLKEDMTEPLYEVLTQGSQSTVTIFQQAERKNPPWKAWKAATPMLARGLLMLRLASACTASLFAEADITKSDLEFWWSVLGTDLGLWDEPTDVETFADLWTDIAEAKEVADERISAIHDGCSVRSVAKILSRDISLTQFARAPMWLLGLD